MPEAPTTASRDAALLRAARALVTELGLDAVLERLLGAAVEATGAAYAAIGVLDEERAGLERFLTRGIPDDDARIIGHLPRGHGVLGLLIEDPHPIRMDSVSRHPRSYGFPPGHPPMDEFLGVPILIRGEPWGNLYLTNKPGGFTDADEADATVLADWAAVAVSNARAFEQSERRRTELERANAALEVTTEITRALGGETDLDRVLELLAKRARALVGARAVVITLIEGEELTLAAGAGDVDTTRLGRHSALDPSPLTASLRARSPRRMGPTELGEGWEAVLGRSDARAAIAVPLLFQGRPLGGLLAVDRLGPDAEYTAEDERLLGAFAASAATAVATAQAVADDRVRAAIAAADQERARWSRELHDDTLQELAALNIQLSAALQADDEDREESLRRAAAHVTRQVRALRDLVTDLRPADLDDLGLGAALRALVDRHADREDVVIRLDHDLRLGAPGTGRLPPEVETTVYRVLQEALSNVVKHAGARHVTVSVREHDDHVAACVRDDGTGFDPDAPAAGFGLRGMRERAELVGGTCTVTTGPGGTAVDVVVPGRRARS